MPRAHVDEVVFLLAAGCAQRLALTSDAGMPIRLRRAMRSAAHLARPPEPTKRPIGFVTTDEKGKKGQARGKI